MAFNLNDFRNKLVRGGARPTQFEMALTWPDAVRGVVGVSDAERDFRFFCTISQIPGEEVKKLPMKYFGRTLNWVGDRDWEDLTLTVVNDEDFKVRKAIASWMRAMQAYEATTSVFNGSNAAGGYATDGVVTQFSRNEGGSPLHSFKFVGMFPVKLNAIELGWEKVDTMEQFTVNFAYQWVEPIDASTGALITA